MTTCLAMLIRLKFLRLDFQSPRLLLNRSQRAQPLMRALLPSLTWLEFAGVNEYMEDLAARIKAPLLDNINIRFFEQIVFDISQLSQFIACAEKLNFPSQAKVYFHSDFVEILLSPSSGAAGNLTLQVSCTTSDGQVSAMAQICHRASPLLSGVGRLEIDGGRMGKGLRAFSMAGAFIPVHRRGESAYHRAPGPLVASALREVTRATAAEVLPALRSLLLEKPEPSEFVEGAIRRFIKMRGPSKHPVAVFRQQSDWEDDLWGA
ncbi:hypothetical protein F5148DRAFT_1152197 [Russula earlei]|uniref:Uncharacterized protein n=1 Tax=Russula earlei TaxID=71964 RepID=A0ACC0TZJ7_9AGAM|nr:hypothetical protein F5148DRAFT_1152197 [Russula earlei]